MLAGNPSPGVSVDNRLPFNSGYWDSWTVRPLASRGPQMNTPLFPTVNLNQHPEMVFKSSQPELLFGNLPLDQLLRSQAAQSAQWSDPSKAGKKLDGTLQDRMKQDGRKQRGTKSKRERKTRWSQNHKRDSCQCAVCKQCRGELQSTWYRHKQETCKCSVCKQKRGETRVKAIPPPVEPPVSDSSDLIPRIRQSWTQPDELQYKQRSSLNRIPQQRISNKCPQPVSRVENARVTIPAEHTLLSTLQWQPVATPAQASHLNRGSGVAPFGCSSLVGTHPASGSLNPGNQSSLRWQDRLYGWNLTGSTSSASSRNYASDGQNVMSASFEGNVPMRMNTTEQPTNSVFATPNLEERRHCNTFHNKGSVSYDKHDALDPFGISHKTLNCACFPAPFIEHYPAVVKSGPLSNRFSEKETNAACLPWKFTNSQPFGFSGRAASVTEFPFGLEVQGKSGLDINHAADNFGQAPSFMNDCDETAKLSNPPLSTCESIPFTNMCSKKYDLPVAVDSTSASIIRSLDEELQVGDEGLMVTNTEATAEHESPEPKTHSVNTAKNETGSGQELQKQSKKLRSKTSLLHQKGTKRKQDSSFVAGSMPKWRQLLHTKYSQVTVVRKIYIRKRATEKSSNSGPQRKNEAYDSNGENSGRLAEVINVEDRLEEPTVASGLQRSSLAGTGGCSSTHITEDAGGFLIIQRDGCVLTKPSVNGGLNREIGREGLEFYGGKENFVASPEVRPEDIADSQNIMKLVSCTTPQLQCSKLPRSTQNGNSSQIVNCADLTLKNSVPTQQETCIESVSIGCLQDILVDSLSNIIRELKRPRICAIDDHLGREVQSANALFQNILATVSISGRKRCRMEANICNQGCGESVMISVMEFTSQTGVCQSKRKRQKSQNHDGSFFSTSILGTNHARRPQWLCKNSIPVCNSLESQAEKIHSPPETRNDGTLFSFDQLTAPIQSRHQHSPTSKGFMLTVDNQKFNCRFVTFSHRKPLPPVYGNLLAVLAQILRLVLPHDTMGPGTWMNILNGLLGRPRVSSVISEIKEIAYDSLKESKLHSVTLSKIMFSQSPRLFREQLSFERMMNTPSCPYLIRGWSLLFSTHINQKQVSKCERPSLDISLKYDEHSEKDQHQEMHVETLEKDESETRRQHKEQKLTDRISVHFTPSQKIMTSSPTSFQELLKSVLIVNTVTPLVISNCPVRTAYSPTIDQLLANNNLPSSHVGDNCQEKTFSSQAFDQIHGDNAQYRSDSSQASHHGLLGNSLKRMPSLEFLEPQSVSRSDIGTSVNTRCGQECSAQKRGCPKGGWPYKECKDRYINQNLETASAIDDDFEVLQPRMGKILSKKDAEYHEKLEIVWQKPFDAEELRNLEEIAYCRKPQLRLRETRHRGVHVQTKKHGFSYLDHHPDLAKKMADASTPAEKLKLLRGFFFWIQHSCMSGAFRPWCSQEENDEANDDCMEYIPEETIAKPKEERPSRERGQNTQKSCFNYMILRSRKIKNVKKSVKHTKDESCVHSQRNKERHYGKLVRLIH